MFTEKIVAIIFGVVSVLLAGFLAWAVIVGKSAGTERDHHLSWAENACASAGSAYKQVDKKGRPLPYTKWGGECLAAIRGLVTQQAQAVAGSVAAINTHQAEEKTKGAADQTAAQRSRDRTSKAQLRMKEAENGVSESNCVGGDWFAGLNELGGLRGPVGPAETRAPCAGAAAEGQPAG